MATRLRSDAAANRAKILAVAREAFVDEGLEISMEEIALRAGLATATLYRRFPTKEDLVAAAFAEQAAACAQLLDGALADPDPWRGFCRLIFGLCTKHHRDRRFLAAFVMEFPHRTEYETFRRRADEQFTQLVRRAQESGSLREDFDPADLSLILLANGGIETGTPEMSIAASQRLASYLLQAFRSDRAAPLAPLPRIPLDPYRGGRGGVSGRADPS